METYQKGHFNHLEIVTFGSNRWDFVDTLGVIKLIVSLMIHFNKSFFWKKSREFH